MRALALCCAVFGGPASADSCGALWASLTQAGGAAVAVRGTVAAPEGDWCVIEDVVLDLSGDHANGWHADRLRLRGSAWPWLAAQISGTDGAGVVPEDLEVEVEGLRLVLSTGTPQMDYLFAAQARANTIDGALTLAWDAAARVLTVKALTVDFPGDNALALSAAVRGVDLSSTGAMQMSATGFAVTKLDLSVVTHGLFEWYVLMALGPALLPADGDMQAAVAGLKAQAAAGIALLPEATFPVGTKAAMEAVLTELPNPSGTLTLALRSEAGVGPSRVLGFAMTGMPRTMAEAAPAFDGVVIDMEWQHDPVE